MHRKKLKKRKKSRRYIDYTIKEETYLYNRPHIEASIDDFPTFFQERKRKEGGSKQISESRAVQMSETDCRTPFNNTSFPRNQFLSGFVSPLQDPFFI